MLPDFAMALSEWDQLRDSEGSKDPVTVALRAGWEPVRDTETLRELDRRCSVGLGDPERLGLRESVAVSVKETEGKLV